MVSLDCTEVIKSNVHLLCSLDERRYFCSTAPTSNLLLSAGNNLSSADEIKSDFGITLPCLQEMGLYALDVDNYILEEILVTQAGHSHLPLLPSFS